MTNNNENPERNAELVQESPVMNAGGGVEQENQEEEVQLDITVILDRSGSMESICDDAIGSFNAFLNSRKMSNPKSLFSVVLFDDEYLLREAGVPIGSVQPLTMKTYIPRGSTALLDAIGKTIRTIEERSHEDEEVMIAILTDGQENSSVEYTLEGIRTLIQEKEGKDWDFVYLSADSSAFMDAPAMGFAADKMAMFQKNNISEAYSEMDKMLLIKMGKARSIKRMRRQNQEEQGQPDKMYQ